MSMSQTAERTDKSESECSHIHKEFILSPPPPLSTRTHSRLQMTVSKLQRAPCVCVCERVEGRADETHAVLTAVGELHSLTDWQVSEASEEAELVDFWQKGGGGEKKEMNG